MEKEELIKLIETLYECFDIEKLHKFEYRGKDVKGKNKYKISYVEKGYDFILITESIIEN